MLAARDWRGWIVPTYDFRPYHDKPVLFYWAVGAASALGGVSERSARIVPAASALLTVLAVYLWAAAVWEPAAGLASAAVLVTAVEFVGLGRYVNLDMMLTLWVTVGLLAVHRWSERPEAPGWLRVAAVAAALGALTKGLVAPVLIGGVSLTALAVLGRLGRLRPRPLLGALVLFLAVAGPWYLAAWLVDPSYLQDFLVNHHVGRFLDTRGRFHPKPAYFPALMLFAGFLPWSLLLPAALRNVLARERRAGPEVFCVVWSVGVLLFFSVSRGKLGTYILPALPALALLTGRYLVRLARARVLPPAERRLVAAGAIVMALVCFAAAPGLHAASARLYEGAWRETSRLALIGLPLGAALLALVWRRRFDRLPAAVAGGMLALIVVFYGLAAPEVSAVVSEAAVARLIAAHPDGARAPVIGFNVRASSLLFYLQRPVRRTTHRAKVADVLAKRPLVFVMTSPRHVPVLLRLGGLYPWHTLGRHVLYASRPPGAVEAAPRR